MSIRRVLRTLALLAAMAISLSGPLAGTAYAGDCDQPSGGDC